MDQLARIIADALKVLNPKGEPLAERTAREETATPPQKQGTQ